MTQPTPSAHAGTASRMVANDPRTTPGKTMPAALSTAPSTATPARTHHAARMRAQHPLSRATTLTLTTASVLAAGLLLSACGGGGGGGGSDTPANTLNIDLGPLVARWQLDGESLGLAGSGNCLGTIAFARDPAGDAGTLDGKPSVSARITETRLTAPGCPIAAAMVTRTDHLDPDGNLLGSDTDGEYLRVTAPPVFPDNATLGTRGTAATLTRYADPGLANAIGEATLAYEVSAPGNDGIATLRLTLTRDSRQTVRELTIHPSGKLSLQAMEVDGIRFTR